MENFSKESILIYIRTVSGFLAQVYNKNFIGTFGFVYPVHRRRGYLSTNESCAHCVHSTDIGVNKCRTSRCQILASKSEVLFRLWYSRHHHTVSDNEGDRRFLGYPKLYRSAKVFLTTQLTPFFESLLSCEPKRVSLYFANNWPRQGPILLNASLR